VTDRPFFSLIVPTYNEAENIVPLLEALRGPLSGTPHEVWVVDDDSPDGTWSLAEDYARRSGEPVRVLRRRKARGLSAAVVDGFAQARGGTLGVMDADLSHDPALWPRLLEALDRGAEASVGSRRVPGGGADHWPRHRRLMSTLGTLFSRIVLGLALRDPMSGFFAVRREVYERGRARLRPRGYKILLEILVKCRVPPTKIVEVPFLFKDRRQGHSKLGWRVAAGFVSQHVDLFLDRWRKRT
jgi:dolichol-phosphate mannosyltransferase